MRRLRLPPVLIKVMFAGGLVVLVCAIAVGWWVERERLRGQIRELENPEFDFRFAQETFNSPHPWGFSGPPQDPPATPK